MNNIKLRRHLHQYPEISGEERETADFVISTLKKMGVSQIHQNFSGASLLAEINFQKPGKTVLFRCELDALPITEENPFDYQSRKQGVSHKCGHDGHMAILLAFAKQLQQKPLPSGKVLLLFQEAEETGKGAQAILKSKILNQFSIDRVIALHNVPGYELGQVVCKPKSFTPSVESLDIKLQGKTSHAGMPEKGVNPATTVAKIIQYCENIQVLDRQSATFFLATPIQVQLGQSAYGTSAGEALVSYTFRCWEHSNLVQQKEKLEKQIKKFTQETAGLSVSFHWKESFQANYNDPETYQLIKRVSESLEIPFSEKELPFTWGEDFGAFTQIYPGAMFGLGAGKDQPELHHPDYDFPDELIETGKDLFYSLSKKIMQ